MKNTATKEAKTPEENKELTSYEKLLKDLDDTAFAYEFKLKKFERAKDIIGDILAVTTGQAVVTAENDEWGRGHLLELFEILSIRHKNFYIPDFLEDLSGHLFSWTFTSDEVSRNWKAETLRKRGLDEYGIELNKTVDEGVSDLPQQPGKELELNDLANLLSKVMKHPKMPAHLYNVIADELSEVHVGTDSPENISANLKLELEREAGSGK